MDLMFASVQCEQTACHPVLRMQEMCAVVEVVHQHEA
jgi:hypothetical protein